jgi:hypothetical protein
LLEALSLFLGRHARADKPSDVGLWFAAGHDNSTGDPTHRDETILFVRVFLIVNLKLICRPREEHCRFFERNTMLLPIRLCLCVTPLESHCMARIYAIG